MLISLRAHRLALWLALSAVLLRALIPAGYMLGRDSGSGVYGLVLCGEPNRPAALKDHLTPTQAGVSHCAFALSAMASVPGADLLLPLFGPQRERSLAAARQSPPALGKRLRPPSRAPPQLS